tara:strand:- start:5 stop:193 length:189 start_codon:yes stop_codon:yes gene_type:complete
MAVLTKADILENKVFCGELAPFAFVSASFDLEPIERIVGVIHLLIHRSVDSGEPKPAPVYRN